MGYIPIILVSVLLNCAAQLSMKKGMMAVGEVIGGVRGFVAMIPAMAVNPYLWLSAFCYIVSIAVWMIVLSKVDVSYAYPFLSIGYILSAVVAYFAFQEAVTPIRVVGILVICAGVILISRS